MKFGSIRAVGQVIATGSISSATTTILTGSSQLTNLGYAITGSNTFTGTQTMAGSIIPSTNNTYDLGSPTYQFRHVYISSGSLYVNGTKVLGSTSQELQITTDVGQSFKILEAGSDTITLQSADGNITLTSSGGGDVILDPNTGVIALKGTTTIYSGNKIVSSDGNAIQFGNGIAITGSIVATGTSLVSGSSQITFSGLSGVPSGLISGSAQESGFGYATTGSNTFQGAQTINGSLNVVGNLTAQQYIVSSSVTYLTESFASGSHKFGDSSDDYHNFTGSLIVTGSLKVTGNASFGSSPQTYSGTAPYSALTFPRGEIMFSNTNTQNQLYIVSNAYLNSSGVFAYRSGSYNANSIAIDDGSISFSSATTGTTDGTITWLPALGISRNANVSVSNSLSVTGSLTVGINSISTTQLNVNTSSVSTQNVMSEFYNSDYTSGTRNFIRVRNAINSGGTMSSYFGQGQDGKTYIVSNDFTKNHIVIDGNTSYVGINKNTPNTQLDVNGNTTVSGSITANDKLTINKAGGSSFNIASFLNTNSTTASQTYIWIGRDTSAGRSGLIDFIDNTDGLNGYLALGINGDDPTANSGFFIKKNSAIGIGTNTPVDNIIGISNSGLLDIAGSGGGALKLHYTSATAYGEFSFYKGSNGSYIDSAGATTLTNNDIIFRTGRSGGSYTVTESMRLSNAGVLTVTSNSNAGNAMNVINNSSGTAAYSGIHIGNNRSSNGGGVVLTSTGYTSGTILGSDTTYVYNNGTGGVAIASESGTGVIKFGTAGVLAMTIDASQNIQMSGTGALTIPKGTTGQRPSAVSGMVRFNTSVGLPEVYTGTDWIYMSALNGSSAETAAPSASVIKALNPAAPNGVYWLKFASGSNTAFQAYIIFDKTDGPWVKAVQWFNTTDLSGSAGVNAGGSWTSSQIGLSAGKIPSADINILKSSLTTLWRVTGSADPLMNYGAGALKIIWSSLPNWGTDAQPTTSQPYDIYVDAANDGTWDYGYRYVPTQQSRCNHTTSIWISDHDSPVGSGSTLLLGTKTSSADYPICWTVGATSWYTNLHPWTGNSAASGGNIQWGSASTAAALYFKN